MFKECKNLEDIRMRQKETGKMLYSMPASDIPAWYDYGFNSADQLDIYLRQKMQLIHVYIPGYIKDLSDLSLYIG